MRMMTKEQIDTSIVSIERRSKRMQDDIHRTAVSILSIWKAGKTDYDVAKWAAESLTRLQNASPYHSNAFSKWVAAFLPCQWSAENKSWYVHQKECHLFTDAFKEARETPFWEVSPPPQPKPFMMLQEIDRIIAKAQKHIENPVEGDEIDPEVIRKLRSLRESVKED